MKRKALAVMAAALLLSGCAEKISQENENETAAEMPEVTAQTSDETAQTSAVLGHDIDPEAVRMGAEGVPYFFSSQEESITFVPSEENVKFNGRYLYHNDVCYLGYTCSSVSFIMTGSKAEAVMVSNADAYGERSQGWLGVMINGELTKRIKLGDGEQSYTLYEGEELENAVITIIKLSENQMASTGIKNITCNARKIAADTKKELSIEFVGDSITCGYGNEAESVSDGLNSAQQNGAATYGYYTAQNLNADWSMVAISGIGLISDYTEEVGEKEDYMLVGDIYDYCDTNFQQRRGIDELTEWEFGEGSDIVVINIGTNDYSYTGKDDDLQWEFRETYYDFIGEVREHNPDAKIVCTLGIMGAQLFDMIESAVDEYKEDTGDNEIYTMKFDYQDEADGYGGNYHPTVATHKKAAEQLTEYIKSIM